MTYNVLSGTLKLKLKTNLYNAIKSEGSDALSLYTTGIHISVMLIIKCCSCLKLYWY